MDRATDNRLVPNANQAAVSHAYLPHARQSFLQDA